MRLSRQLALIVLLLPSLTAHGDDVITQVMSPIASYSFVESYQTDALANGGIESPLVSFQRLEDFSSAPLDSGGFISSLISYSYFEWPGDDILHLQYSPMVSYYYQRGIATPAACQETERFHLVAYYPLDGTPDDSSGYDLNGALHNVSFAPAVLGAGADFGGTDSFIEVPSSELLSPEAAVSVSLWFNVRSFHNAFVCLAYKAAIAPTTDGFQDRSYSLWARSDGGIHFTSTGQGDTAQTQCNSPANGFAVGQFVHVVGVVDANAHVMRIYLNGVEVASSPFQSSALRQGTFPLRLGGPFITGNDQSGLDGVLDEVRIFDRALSEDEVRCLYNVGQSVRPVALRGRVTDVQSNPIAGVNVSARVYLSPVAQATTDANGFYEVQSLASGVYDLWAVQANYQTSIRTLTIGANAAEQNFQLKPMPGAPAAHQTSRLPDLSAVVGTMDSELLIYDGTQFRSITFANRPSADRMTIVLTHGWNSSAYEWAENMASRMWAKGINADVANIVAWNWEFASRQSAFPPEERIPAQGAALGRALLGTLGASYSQPIHLICTAPQKSDQWLS